MLGFFENIVSQICYDAVSRAAEQSPADGAEKILNDIRSEEKRHDYIQRLLIFARDNIIYEHFRDIRRNKAERRYDHRHNHGKRDDFKFGLDIFYEFGYELAF